MCIGVLSSVRLLIGIIRLFIVCLFSLSPWFCVKFLLRTQEDFGVWQRFLPIVYRRLLNAWIWRRCFLLMHKYKQSNTYQSVSLSWIVHGLSRLDSTRLSSCAVKSWIYWAQINWNVFCGARRVRVLLSRVETFQFELSRVELLTSSWWSQVLNMSVDCCEPAFVRHASALTTIKLTANWQNCVLRN